jgi:hypothetical protein
VRILRGKCRGCVREDWSGETLGSSALRNAAASLRSAGQSSTLREALLRGQEDVTAAADKSRATNNNVDLIKMLANNDDIICGRFLALLKNERPRQRWQEEWGPTSQSMGPSMVRK